MRPTIIDHSGRSRRLARCSARFAELGRWLADESGLGAILAVRSGEDVGDSCVLAGGLPLHTGQTRSAAIAFRLALHALEAREGGLVALLPELDLVSAVVDAWRLGGWC